MKYPVKKNEIHEVVIEDLTHQGYGVAKINGLSVFVENTLPQERVQIRIERIEKRFAFGKLLEIFSPSKDRVEVKDILQTRLGTMPLQHIAYPSQLQYKKKIVMDALARHIKLEGILIHDTIGMDDPFHYRNKAQIPVREINGQLETGFFKRGTHDLVPVENYQIQDKKIDEAILVIRDLLRHYQIKAYDEDNHRGLIRHIIVRKGHHTQEMMLIFVTNNQEFPFIENIIQDILTKLPNIVSIIQNINSAKTNVIMGKKQRILFGEDAYYDRLDDLVFAISAKSFYQVNSIQTEKLYAKALELAKISHDDVVIDAYCGIGTISLFAAKRAKHVYGVEVVPDAIEMAKCNQKMNQIENASFEVGKAEDIMKKWVKQGLEVDVLMVDPPRKGLEASFIESSIETNPKRIVYVSCNPQTLGRDLALYQKHGYIVQEVQPVDMFPHTTHVETVVLMSRLL